MNPPTFALADAGSPGTNAIMAMFAAGAPIAVISPSAIRPFAWPNVAEMRRARELALRYRAIREARRMNPFKTALRLASLRRQLALIRPDYVLIWTGITGRSGTARRAAEIAELPAVFFERAPMPERLQIDLCGVNAGNSIPRDPLVIRKWKETLTSVDDWREIAARVVSRAPRKGSKVSQRLGNDLYLAGNFLFCPLQVPSDTQVVEYGGWVRGMRDYIARLAECSHALPGGWHLRLKQHPSARQSLAPFIKPLLSDRFRLDDETSSVDQLRASRGVITLNSSMGLEAFFFDKPVITLGSSYYAGHGRTLQADSPAEVAALVARPDALGFDPQARDDLMTCLLNDYFVRIEDLRAGRFGLPELLDRHARLAALGAPAPQGIMRVMTAAIGQPAR